MDGLLTKQELELLDAQIQSPLYRELGLREILEARRRAAAPRGLRGLLHRLSTRLGAWAERRAAAAELAPLTGHELADIGLLRTEVGSIARL